MVREGMSCLDLRIDVVRLLHIISSLGHTTRRGVSCDTSSRPHECRDTSQLPEPLWYGVHASTIGTSPLVAMWPSVNHVRE